MLPRKLEATVPFLFRNWACPKCAKVLSFQEWASEMGDRESKRLSRASASAELSQKIAKARIEHQKVCPARAKPTGSEAGGPAPAKAGRGCLVLVVAAIAVIYLIAKR